MIEKFVIKPAFIDKAHYVSLYNENDVILEPIDKAKYFVSKQEAEDYLEGFPYLVGKDGAYINAFVIETVFLIEK